MPKDYYAILGVDKTATDGEIKIAFRQKAKNLHPDVNSGADAQSAFQELNEAYSILSNSVTRARFDTGELSEPEVTFTWEEVDQILRERELKREQEWRQDFGYPGEKIYPPTNYAANEKVARMVNLGLLIFAFTFVLDFFIFFNVGSERIISQSTLVRKFRNGPSQTWIESKTKSTTFYISYANPRPQIGDEVLLKRSLIYSNYKFKTTDSESFKRADDLPIVTYIIAGLVCILAWFGTSKYFNPERKFNAAIISFFLCIVLLVILLYPK